MKTHCCAEKTAIYACGRLLLSFIDEEGECNGIPFSSDRVEKKEIWFDKSNGIWHFGRVQKYRWISEGIVMYCPWCGVKLEGEDETKYC